MWTQITQAATPLPPLLLSHPDANGTLDEKHMRGVTLQRTAWGGDNMSNPWGPSGNSSNCIHWKHLNDAASSSPDNLHNCSHCLNHCDHQQASLDISLSLWFPSSHDSDSDDLLLMDSPSLASVGGCEPQQPQSADSGSFVTSLIGNLWFGHFIINFDLLLDTSKLN